MSLILVLGGYGGFGARISRRLVAAGHDVLVAGRRFASAEAFCAGEARLTPLALDRADIAAVLDTHRPDVVVDASGPFQAMDHAVPRACIDAGIAYCDIADSRTFVCGIPALDAAAKEAGVPVIAGASSVPALSGAAIRMLAQGMERVCAVEIAISASNRASAGAAVSTAILAQVGQSFVLWRGGREAAAFGWQEATKIDFALPCTAPLRNRRVALVDVPDVALFPSRLPGAPAVVFRAGTELGIHNLALWLASWPVRWRWLRGLTPLACWIAPLRRLTTPLGSDRSAMRVALFGEAAGQRLERRWTLIADSGDGPEIPALSVPLLVERILRGDEAPGARDAGDSLELADYEPAFRTLAIRHGVEARMVAEPLYRQAMGDAFDRLPDAVRRMHEPLRDAGAVGEATVIGAATRAGALIGRIMRFPPPGRYPLHVHFSQTDRDECWTRSFGPYRFSSRLSRCKEGVVERFGPLRFRFALPPVDGGLAMVMKGWTLCGIPMPLIMAPRTDAREWEDAGRFHFDVAVALPLLGRIVHYRGWLMDHGATEPEGGYFAPSPRASISATVSATSTASRSSPHTP